MRKLRDLAARNDLNAWYSVSGFWPTKRGSYESAAVSTAIAATATTNAPSYVTYAFCYSGSSSGDGHEYVCTFNGGATATVVYEASLTANTVTSRYTNATAPASISMIRYGNTTLMAIGIAGVKIQAATLGGAFADAGAGAPTAQTILATQSNAVFAASHTSNAWAFSDVGDYTNWTTGESASGVLDGVGGGNITAAVSFGNDLYVFQPASIYRFTYVGGVVKWQAQIARTGIGIPDRQYLAAATNSGASQATQDWAVATQYGIAFYGGNGSIYLFDGVSAPKCLNPETTVPVEAIGGVFTYDPVEGRLCIAPGPGSSATGTVVGEGGASLSCLYWYYSFPSDMWGASPGGPGETYAAFTPASGVARGAYFNRRELSSKPPYWIVSTAGTNGVLSRCGANSTSSAAAENKTATHSLQTAMIGGPDKKITVRRVTPLTRRRTAISGATPSASATVTFYRELDDAASQSTQTAAESSLRKRFDLIGSDNLARIQVTWTGYDVEVDDFLIDAVPSGTD